MLQYTIDMKRLLLAFIFAAFCCSIMSQPVTPITESHNQAIEIAITDFLKCNLRKKYSAFSVSIYEKSKYDRYEVSDNLIVVSILPSETTAPQYYITSVDTLGTTRLPTRHIIKDGKLFYWYDSDYGLTEETIRVFRDYNLVDLLENSGLDHIMGQEVYGDDFAKAAQYYMCKNDLTNYKRVISSIGIGGYKPPKPRCNR